MDGYKEERMAEIVATVILFCIGLRIKKKLDRESMNHFETVAKEAIEYNDELLRWARERTVEPEEQLRQITIDKYKKYDEIKNNNLYLTIGEKR